MKIDTHKLGVSLSLWIISSLLGLIPIFFEFVSWYVERGDIELTSEEFLKKLLTSSDLYFALVSVLLASLIELVLEKGNKYVFLIFLNVIFNIICLILYNISHFIPSFLTKVFKAKATDQTISTDAVIGFFIIVFSTAIVVSIINIVFLSFKIPNSANGKKALSSFNSVKVF